MEAAAHIPQLDHEISRADVLGMWRMRWGIRRNTYRVEPGLYRLGAPGAESPILVTGNYKFTVDVVRRDTAGLDAWLLVLDTKGINVWCAAGKGTFGTSELIGRVMGSDLPLLAESQTLILPQLGAPGVSAHEVRAATGYRVVYGPVDVADTKAFIEAGNKATDEMRTVTFGFKERIELAPVELVGMFRSWKWLVPIGLFVAGLIAAYALSATGLAVVGDLGVAFGLITAGLYLVGVISGAIVVPALLPWIPGRMFAAKGALAGALVSAPLALRIAWPVLGAPAGFGGIVLAISAMALGAVLIVAAVSSFVAMNFTGASPITSPTGVERELRRWIPIQVVMAALGLVGWLGGPFLFFIIAERMAG